MACPPLTSTLRVQKHEKARREKARDQAVEEVDENFIRLYWEQMLQVWRRSPPCCSCRIALPGLKS